MNTAEVGILTRLRSAIDLMVQGSLSDARGLLTEIGADGSPALCELVKALTLLMERLAESIASKESALGRVQLSMLELEKADSEMRTNEARYRDLFSNMNDCVAVFEAVDGGGDFTFKDVNSASLRLEQVEREAVLGRGVTEVFPGVEALGLLDVMRRVYHTGTAEHLPARFYQDHRISGWRENFVYRLPTLEVVVVYRDVSVQRATMEEFLATLATTERLIDAAPIGLVVVGEDQTVQRVNQVACQILAGAPADMVGQSWRNFDPSAPSGRCEIRAEERDLRDVKGNTVGVLMSVIPVTVQGKEVVNIEAFLDLTERKGLETQLRQAQKLESLGQLAAGIAHEINTPTQYVGDNTRFLQDALGNLLTVGRISRELLAAAKQGCVSGELIDSLESKLQAADLEYLSQEAPQAIEQTLEGVDRIMKIVRSMKEFSHPGCTDRESGDINKAIETTVTVARNEWKYVADVETDLDPSLPLVPCFVGEMNQVFLNILINAAHAIGDVVDRAANQKGKIRISTRGQADWVEIRVSDTGGGIPESIRHRIFDPFFTTKQVGKGTGQGLAIAHRVVVEKHGGTLSFETEEGAGTTFIIRLPLQTPDLKEAA
jgi:two-component system, NtrC family, sensor kinase